MSTNIVSFPSQSRRKKKRMEERKKKLELHLSQHNFLTTKLEANKLAWASVVKEYESLDRELKNGSGE